MMGAEQRAAEQRYGSAQQCAEYMGRSSDWFLEHVAPHLHAVVVGNRRIYSFAEIDAWWAGEAVPGSTVQSTGEPAGAVRKVGRPRRVV